jgi:hypothetical protein
MLEDKNSVKLRVLKCDPICQIIQDSRRKGLLEQPQDYQIKVALNKSYNTKNLVYKLLKKIT